MTVCAPKSSSREAARDKYQGEGERDLWNQYHAKKRRDTNRGKHVLEQDESKNHRDTATTAVAATNRQNARERKRDMLAQSGDGQ